MDKLSLLRRGAIFLSISSLLFYFYMNSVEFALDVPTMHLDGAFQTASSLHRLHARQLIGKDFLPYLGVGPTLINYPIFTLAGGNLAASQISTFFSLQMILAFVIFVNLLFVFPKSVWFIVSICPAIVVLYYNNYFSGIEQHIIGKFYQDPGNSLRPVRSFAPYIFLFATFMLTKSFTRWAIQLPLLSFCLSLSLAWSNDYALAVFAFGLFFYFSRTWAFFNLNQALINSVSLFVISLLMHYTLMSFATGMHYDRLLAYNFIDVRTDQWWLFGPYSELHRIFTVSDIFKIFNSYNLIGILLGILLFVTFIFKRDERLLLVSCIGGALFSGGLISSVGGHVDLQYFEPFFVWTRLTIALTVIYILSVSLFYVCPPVEHKNFYIVAQKFIVSVALIFQLFSAWDINASVAEKRLAYDKDPKYEWVPELGGYIEKEFSEYLNIARANKGKVVSEEYWGLWSAINKSFPQWPNDALIHALGEARSVAKENMPKNEIVITTRYDYSSWQNWSFSQNFWFYRNLIQNWEPIFQSPTTVVWERANTRKALTDVSCEIEASGLGVEVNNSTPGLYSVKLTYVDDTQGRHLLLLNNHIPYVVDLHGTMSLPTGNNTITVPLRVIKEGDKSKVEVLGGRQPAFKIVNCEAELLPEFAKNIVGPYVPFPTNIWYEQGVAKVFTGFIVRTKPENIEDYKAGRTLRLGNGEEREIVLVENPGRWLRVYFDGEKLDVDIHGNPSEYRFVDR